MLIIIIKKKRLDIYIYKYIRVSYFSLIFTNTITITSFPGKLSPKTSFRGCNWYRLLLCLLLQTNTLQIESILAILFRSSRYRNTVHFLTKIVCIKTKLCIRYRKPFYYAIQLEHVKWRENTSPSRRVVSFLRFRTALAIRDGVNIPSSAWLLISYCTPLRKQFVPHTENDLYLIKKIIRNS